MTEIHKNINLNQYFSNLMSADYTLTPEINIIDTDVDLEIYVVGDLEGHIDLLYHFLLSKKFIDEELNWIAADNVYLVQCGDQLDAGKGVKPRIILKDTDLAVVLFMDYLNIKSKNHVLSVLGNHEWMNVQGQYHDAKDLGNSQYDNNNNRTKLFDYDTGLIAKIIKRRNFVIRIGRYLFCHGGITEFEIEEFIEATKEEGNTNLNRDNWNNDDVNKFVSRVNSEVMLKENWKSNTVTDFFTTVLLDPIDANYSKGILWERFLNQNKFSPLLEEYIIVTGHNSLYSINYCYNNPTVIINQDPNCEENPRKDEKPHMIMTDVVLRQYNYEKHKEYPILKFLLINNNILSDDEYTLTGDKQSFELNGERILLDYLASQNQRGGYKYKYEKYKQKYLNLKKILPKI